MAGWEQRLETLRSQLRKWEQTHLGMEDYVKQQAPGAYEYMQNNPFSGTDLSRNSELTARKNSLDEQLQAARAQKEALEKQMEDLEEQLEKAKDSADPKSLAERMKEAAAKAGKKWEDTFGKEQSPEEIADILSRLRLDVVSRRNRLEDAQKRYEECLAAPLIYDRSRTQIRAQDRSRAPHSLLSSRVDCRPRNEARP
jgi:predicted nuclease with TOPRIM domain